jgi:hypothetical protein
MPCGVVETPEDKWIFEPRLATTGHRSSTGQHDQNDVAGITTVEGTNSPGQGIQESKLAADSLKEVQTTDNEDVRGPYTTEQDVEMTGVQNQEMDHGGHTDRDEQTREPKSEEVETPVGDLPQHPDTIEARANGSNTMNSHLEHNNIPGFDGTLHRDRNDHANDSGVSGDGSVHTNHKGRNEDQGDELDKDEEMQDGLSPEPPHRMTTRAQANATNPQQEGESDNISPSPSSDTLSSLPMPHPLFLVPDSIRADPNLGLLPMEAEETRRLLWSYVQKQEETVRGFEHMLECLLRACRMKDDVLEWCKAEGHVGEMSDGEDWYDREKWGLADGEDLKKGADEDEIELVEESRASNKRGRGRRA